MSITSIMTTFLSHPGLKTLEDGKQSLLPLRNTSIAGYSLQSSRSIWYALLLYKFKTEQDVPEPLWNLSRELILQTLRNKTIPRDITQTYLAQFNEWKERDYQSFIHQVAMFYAQLLELHEAVSRVQNEETIKEWRPSYTALLQKVRDAAKKMGFLEQMDQIVEKHREEKEALVYHVMHQAFWDMFEEELGQGNMSLFICQLNECKQLLHVIVPSSEHSVIEEMMPMESLTQQITAHAFSTDDVWNIAQWCFALLRAWDSQSSMPLYEKIISTLGEVKERVPFHKFVRIVMELVMVCSVELSTRKQLWTTLFRQVEHF